MTERQSRRRGPKPGRRRALELLASCRDGCTEAIMVAHGFAVEMLADLIRDGADRARGGRQSVDRGRARYRGQRWQQREALLAGRAVEEEWQ
jgi:hypothetical protein